MSLSECRNLLTHKETVAISNMTTQPQHGAVLLGGTANIAFREDEELQPYKKKNRALLLSASLDDAWFTIPAHKAIACDPATSQALKLVHEVQQREECTSSTPTDDGASDILTESMLSASSDILLADDLGDLSQLESPGSPSRPHTAGHSNIAEV